LESRTPLRIVFGIDLRTLALFRVLLGTYLLLNIATRAQDLTAHYTDVGIMPRSVQLGLLADGSWSLHLFNGTFWGQSALFAIAAFAALGLVVGWQTRLMTIISWILLLSVQQRNTFILSGEDNLALLLNFWAMFLPLGARFSVDQAVNRCAHGEAQSPNAYWSWAATALLLQGMSMYFFSALLKSDPIWIPDGTAVYYALNLDYMVTSFAIWFRQFGTLMQGLTYYVWLLELIGPILIFTPVFQKPTRAILMVLFMTMHLGFVLFLEIGLFPFISIVMNLTFMPGWMWDWIERRLTGPEPGQLIIWYDQDCGFCLKMCHLMRVFLFLPNVKIQPAQQEPEMDAILSTNNSWVVTREDRLALKWAAFGLLLRSSPVFRPLAVIAEWPWINWIGDHIYDLVAKHRSFLSSVTTRLLPWRHAAHSSGEGNVSSLIAIGLFLFVTVQNLSTLPQLGIQLPNSFVQVRQALGLWQNWTMFAPFPEMDSPRPVIIGELEDGTQVDLYGAFLSAGEGLESKHDAKFYPNGRWRKFLANLEDQSYRQVDQVLALNYARYLCSWWNRSRSDVAPLSTFSIKFIVHRTNAPGESKRLRVNDVWFHDCFDTAQ
jgi:predicted DCC family thiol-disulfide oxidoreductase YuxK